MRNIKLCTRFALIVAVCLGMSAPAFAQTVVEVQKTVEGRALNLVIPDGFCPVERDAAIFRDWYAFQDRLIEGRGAVILMYASCAEVEKRKANPDYFVENHGAYVAVFPFGASAAVPPGFTRAMTVDFISKTIPRVATENVGESISARIRQLDLDKQLQLSEVTIGYLDEDKDAVYAGLVSWFHRGASKVRTIGVGGFTQVAGLVISANLYADEGPQVTFGALLERQQKLMRDLLARNP